MAHKILNSCPGGSLYLDNESVELNDFPDQLPIYKLLICISSPIAATLRAFMSLNQEFRVSRSRDRKARWAVAYKELVNRSLRPRETREINAFAAHIQPAKTRPCSQTFRFLIGKS